MYKSPIELIYQGTEMQIERGILRAVHKQDINVDRDELIRALQYDRNQYEKGYQDGLAAGGFVLCSNCRFYEYGRCRFWGAEIHPENFCSFAEREDNGTE